MLKTKKKQISVNVAYYLLQASHQSSFAACFLTRICCRGLILTPEGVMLTPEGVMLTPEEIMLTNKRGM